MRKNTRDWEGRDHSATLEMKRAREVPCPVCHHWHKWEQGETCAVCGHVPTAEQQAMPKESAFPTEVLADFLYLGSYDNAARNELLKAVGIRHIVNTVRARPSRRRPSRILKTPASHFLSATRNVHSFRSEATP